MPQFEHPEITHEGEGLPPENPNAIEIMEDDEALVTQFRADDEREVMMDPYALALQYEDRVFEPLPTAAELWPQTTGHQVKIISCWPFIMGTDFKYLGVICAIGKLKFIQVDGQRALKEKFQIYRKRVNINDPRRAEQFFQNGKTPGMDFTIPLFQLFEFFKPIRVSASEWESIVGEMAPAIERDRKIHQDEQAAIVARNKNYKFLHDSQRNPQVAQDATTTAMARGFAQALIEAGVVIPAKRIKEVV